MARTALVTLLLSSFLAAGTAAPALAQAMSAADLAANTHIHGLSFDRANPGKIFVATHHGLMHASLDGLVTAVSAAKDDFMGFTPHPTDTAILFASGHPAAGGNLGFIKSTDSGKTWTHVSPGAAGPVDFHQMGVSPSNPDVLYGSFGGIQASRDGGSTWAIVGESPEGLIDLAVSPVDPEKLYAATKTGLMVSRDGAKSWEALIAGAPVTTVELAADGTIYVFAHGRGMLRASESNLNFETIGQGAAGADYLLHLAVDKTAPQRLVAVTGEQAIVVSTDAGVTWREIGK